MAAADDILAPVQGRVLGDALTASAETVVDLEADFPDGVGVQEKAHFWSNRYVSICPNGSTVWFAFSDTDSTALVVDGSGTDLTIGVPIPSNGVAQVRSSGYRYLHLISDANCVVTLWPSSVRT